MIDFKTMESDVVSDLGIGLTATKGKVVSVRNCWHFYTAGDSVEVMFHNGQEFLDGMNRIFPIVACYDVLILAFVLMDTHVHFVLYGDFDSCNRFIHEYVRRTSMYLSLRYQKRKSLKDIEINHQSINDDRYLKTAICYVLKNPLSAGLPYNPWDYPWSSGSLYYRSPNIWTSPKWMLGMDSILQTAQDKRMIAKTRVKIDSGIRVVDNLILPDQYVAVTIVERLFKSHKAFYFYMSISKDVDIESRGGAISQLTVPLSEMRDNRRMLSQEMFGEDELRCLKMEQRLLLARRMKSRYNSSPKQIARLCGLVYDEVMDLL